MVKNLAILGSTGSIGTQTLDVARTHGIKVSGLAAGKNFELVEKQAREFRPRAVAMADEEAANKLRERLADLDIEVLSGNEGIERIAAIEEAETVVAAIVGIAGLRPVMRAIECGKDIALANKETLVTAGSLVMKRVREKGLKLLPVDSEHSAIFQCLVGNRHKDASGILLTASGGPFRGRSYQQMKEATLEDALKHPNWSMGSKITIDSATLMNKGLEVIEARWLFNMEADRIKVLIHPQSIIHSAVEYVDGSIIAQLGSPDMRIPIQYALSFPERVENNYSRLDLIKTGNLTFEEPDFKAFPCLGLAFEALEAGGTMPVVLNAANEAAVGLFLSRKIGFTDIPETIESIMDKHIVNTSPSMDDIIEVDKWAREEVYKTLGVL